jgi:hypothetical protein
MAGGRQTARTYLLGRCRRSSSNHKSLLRGVGQTENWSGRVHYVPPYDHTMRAATRRCRRAGAAALVPPRWCRRAGAAFELLKGCTWIPSSTLYMHHLTSIHSLGCSGSYTNIRGRIQLRAHRKPSLAQPGRRGDEGGTGARGVSRGWNSLQGAQPCPDTQASKQVKQLQKG